MSRSLAALALLAVLAAGCTVCGLIDQEVVVAADDPELGPLISDCMNGVPPPADFPCAAAPKLAASPPGSACACLPLCERVLAIVNPDPNRPALQRCAFSLDATKGQARVEIEYRSVCQ